MSPSEADLRGALHDGEDDPDPSSAALLAEQIILDTAVRRARRRTRLLTAAAAVLVVGGLGTGLGFVVGGNHESGSSGGSAAAEVPGAARAAVPGSRPASGGLPPDHQSAGGAAGGAAAQCPPTLARYVASGAAGQVSHGGGGTMFDGLSRPIRSIVICSYSAEAAQRKGAPASTTVTGELAHDLADVALSPGPTPATCNRRVAYALIGHDTSGRTQTVSIIPATRSCNVVIGTRYQGPPPRRLSELLARLAPPVGLNPPPSGIESGRPPR